MAKTMKDYVDAANETVQKIDVAEAQRLIAEENAQLIDVRTDGEVAKSGKAKGAVNIPRGLLEFMADPTLESQNAALKQSRPLITYCAAGGRAALAGKTLQEMGYGPVYNVGGFKGWVEAGGETEDA